MIWSGDRYESCRVGVSWNPLSIIPSHSPTSIERLHLCVSFSAGNRLLYLGFLFRSRLPFPVFDLLLLSLSCGVVSNGVSRFGRASSVPLFFLVPLPFLLSS